MLKIGPLKVLSSCGEELFKKCGVAFYTDPKTSSIYKGIKESAKLYKIPLEELNHTEAEKKFPFLKAPQNFSLLFEKNAGLLHVEASLRALAENSKKLGAKIFENETLVSWKETKGIEITTNRATYSADKIIFTAGGWTSQLLGDLKIPLKLFRAIQYWFEVKSPNTLHYPSYGFHLADDFYYGFPSLNGKTLKVAAHFGIDPIAKPEDKELDQVPAERLKNITNFVQNSMPEVLAKCISFSPCLYTMTPDEHFILDKHPNYNNVTLACGFSGHGFKFAPAIGEILADLSANNQSPYPIDFLRLSRPGL